MTFTRNEKMGLYSTLAEMCNIAIDICKRAKGYCEESRHAASSAVDYIIGGFYRFYSLSSYTGKFNADLEIIKLLETFDRCDFAGFEDDENINSCITLLSFIGERACLLWKHFLD